MKKYWRSLNDKQSEISDHDLSVNMDSKEDLDRVLDLFGKNLNSAKSNRRDFLKMCGYGLALSTVVAGCENTVQRAIPYLIKPEEVIPGMANYYASSYLQGSDYCSILIKTREGRPIKIEGNQQSGITEGGTSSRVQASVLDLYDTNRYRNPSLDGNTISWDKLDEHLMLKLSAISQQNGNIVLLTPTIYSPSTIKTIRIFLSKYPSASWLQYDSVSVDAMLKANETNFGKPLIPDYRFDKAEVILSFGADFLGTWLSPVEYSCKYAKNRKKQVDKSTMFRHIHLESRLSLTGSNADDRIAIKPSQEGGILAQLYSEISGERGVDELSNIPVDIKAMASELLNKKGASLVVSDSNDPSHQLLVNAINWKLGNYGNTILWEGAIKVKQSHDNDVIELIQHMNQGRVQALLCYDVNPCYDYPQREAFVQGMHKVPLTVGMTCTPDETTQQCKIVAPVNHFLESWNDAEAKQGLYSLSQPGIHPLFSTRQFQDSLLIWCGKKDDYYSLIRKYWKQYLFPLQSDFIDFHKFWTITLQRGIFEPESKQVHQIFFNDKGIREALENCYRYKSSQEIELILYEGVAIGTGRQANNPWLQELPDPIARVCWDNFVSLSPQQCKEMNLKQGDLVEISGLILPVYIQPGQAYATAAVALGYGREECGAVGKDVGKNAYGLIRHYKGFRQRSVLGVHLRKVGENYSLAMVQTHHSMEGRDLVREATLVQLRNGSVNEKENSHFGEESGIYPTSDFPNHHWGMAIDLNACIGCGTCVVACQAENNIPVVGKDEVCRVHEMHWMRIDRYFAGDDKNPEVVFQPVMCQHCDNAPCENVCPVAATNHSSEGLNQMIYNRCIGTRYCGNNCPYKVRRFNWFDYTGADSMPENLHDVAGMTLDLKRLVLNPDVTVRAKGVIEKCSLCIQRIQEGKLKAKKEGRSVKDGEIKTACEQSCPSKAIVFGDLNDSQSRISQCVNSGRSYHLLEDIHTLPSVSYMTRIRNRSVKST